DLAAAARDAAAQREPVRVVDLAGLAHGAGLRDLVAGREQGDARARMHERLHESERGQEPDVLRAQHVPPRDDGRAARDVFAAPPHVGARLERTDAYARTLALDDLLRVDGVHARGNGRADHDAQRLAALDGAVE